MWFTDFVGQVVVAVQRRSAQYNLTQTQNFHFILSQNKMKVLGMGQAASF